MTAETPADQAVLDTLRRTPAAHLAEDMAAAEVTGDRGVAVKELAFPVQLAIRAEPGTPSAQRIESALGITLPLRHGEVTGNPEAAHVIWLSPDEFSYLDVSRRQRPDNPSNTAAAALEGLPGQVIDVSANRAVLELTGPSARDVLEKGCAMDLHPTHCQPGMGFSTQVGPVPVVLHCLDQNRFRIAPRASFTDYLVAWLLDAMREYGSDPVHEVL